MPVEYYLTNDGKELWDAIFPLLQWTMKRENFSGEKLLIALHKEAASPLIFRSASQVLHHEERVPIVPLVLPVHIRLMLKGVEEGCMVRNSPVGLPELRNPGEHRDMVILPPACLRQPVCCNEPEPGPLHPLFHLILRYRDIALALPPFHELGGRIRFEPVGVGDHHVPALFEERLPGPQTGFKTDNEDSSFGPDEVKGFLCKRQGGHGGTDGFYPARNPGLFCPRIDRVQEWLVVVNGSNRAGSKGREVPGLGPAPAPDIKYFRIFRYGPGGGTRPSGSLPCIRAPGGGVIRIPGKKTEVVSYSPHRPHFFEYFVVGRIEMPSSGSTFTPPLLPLYDTGC